MNSTAIYKELSQGSTTRPRRSWNRLFQALTPTPENSFGRLWITLGDSETYGLQVKENESGMR